ncbi:MAG: ABC transporter permease [Clostridiales bacterium]|nr:ABC transporter permease [Clostridiales bacterium]
MLLKYIKPVLLLAISTAIILSCLGLLRDLDYILVNYITAPSYMQYENIKSRYAKEAAPFIRSSNITVYTEFRNVRNTTIYSCDEQFRYFMDLEMVSGSFLVNDDVRDNNPYAVIDENIAVLLFSNTDCIGRSIYIQDKEFKVIGVVGTKDGFFDTLTAVDLYSVYVPFAGMALPNSLIGSIYRADNPIIINTISGLDPYSFGSVQNTVSISMRAKTVAMIGHLALLAIWVIALVFVFRVVRKYLWDFVSLTKEELGSRYLLGYLQKHWLSLVLHVLVIAIMTALLVIWFRLVRFQPEMDPSLVPSELFRLKGWLESIKEYALVANTRVSLPFSPSILIDKIKFVLLAAGFAAVFSAARLFWLARERWEAQNMGHRILIEAFSQNHKELFKD